MRILYAHTAPIDYIRVRKNVQVFNEIGDTTYVGAERENMRYNTSSSFESHLSHLTYVKTELCILEGWRGVIGLFKYAHHLRQVVMISKPDVVVLTNEELYILFRFLNPWFSGRIIIDAIDALDLRSNRKRLVTKIFKLIVIYSRKSAEVVVEVEEFRRDLRPNLAFNSVIIRNTPPSKGTREVNVSKVEVPYIYASGSLNSEINGIETLVSATKNSKYNVVIAGDIVDNSLLKSLQDNDHVTLLGRIGFEESIEFAKNSFAMFAHYSPNNLNFVFAAPNKVYEAFMLGKPLLINIECKISDFCVNNGFGYPTIYGDVTGLLSKIRQIEDLSGTYNAKLIQERFVSDYCWEEESKKWKHVLSQK